MKPLLICATLLTAISMTGCAKWTGAATATEAARCEVWGKSLPTRSHSDTQQTQDEIAVGYAVFSLACPDHEHLLPE